ncbi:hypothetical protein ACFQL1_05160 [Halomicroarcula sp. GCM10025709]|uniref:hypothetical protein n=1 Tax=Halomicroarcula sp. GCM10025709 TaxID=3252669 RepID=UPI00360C9059
MRDARDRPRSHAVRRRLAFLRRGGRPRRRLQAAWCPRSPGDSEGYRPEYVLNDIGDLVGVLGRTEHAEQP